MRTIFTFTITNRKKRYYTLFSNIFLLLVSGFYVFYRLTRYGSGEQRSITGSFIVPAVIFLVILLRFIFMLRRKDIRFTQIHFAVLLTFCWALNQQYLFAGIILILGIFEYVVNRDTTCIADEQGVRLNAFPLRSYRWPELQNVMIYEGMFTIDRKNNHIFQVDVSEETLSFSEEQFNAFCAAQLQS